MGVQTAAQANGQERDLKLLVKHRNALQDNNLPKMQQFLNLMVVQNVH